mmetsp:Transcript_78036/g.216770  ORF Transcript_78036/g.216770 Transcript_78036/m.216770 type:complete len:257 (-) Transcript_78036:599-1369(-)
MHASCIHHASSSRDSNSSFVVLTMPSSARGLLSMHAQHTPRPQPPMLPLRRRRMQTTPRGSSPEPTSPQCPQGVPGMSHADPASPVCLWAAAVAEPPDVTATLTAAGGEGGAAGTSFGGGAAASGACGGGACGAGGAGSAGKGAVVPGNSAICGGCAVCGDTPPTAGKQPPEAPYSICSCIASSACRAAAASSGLAPASNDATGAPGGNPNVSELSGGGGAGSSSGGGGASTGGGAFTTFCTKKRWPPGCTCALYS